jgi:hypothetical protein
MLNPMPDESMVTSLGENRGNEQYFFTPETVESLVKVSLGNVACLCTPTVAESLINSGKKDVVVFDIDPRLKSLWPDGNTLVAYDLKRGLHSNHDQNTDELTPSHEYQYDTVIFDPPFSHVTPEEIARNVNALLKFDLTGETYAYIIYPRSGGAALEEAFEELGFVGQEREDITIKHQFPPRGYTDGRKQITCFQFRRV